LVLSDFADTPSGILSLQTGRYLVEEWRKAEESFLVGSVS
jgi:hypothetical protein